MRFDGGGDDAPQAVSRNMSHSGMLMATARQLDEGSSVTLVFRLRLDDPEEHRIEGRIVRSQPNGDDPNGLWPYWVAVEFDQPATDLEPLIEEAYEKIR
jgi:Tfp pilus assembly protein PilZ